MTSKILVAIVCIGILLFVVSCGPSDEADTADVEQVEEEHDEDEHAPEDHMAGTHNVPSESAAVLNPISAVDDSLVSGAAIFAQSCAVCHGEEGRGDGPTAEALEIIPADLTAGHVQELSDGALFYIISHGKPETPMPAWEGVLEEEERWNVVNFMRTLVGGTNTLITMEDEHAEDERSD